MDATHFPFVHDAMLGEEGDPVALDDYEVERTEEGLRTGPITVSQPVGDHRRVPVTSVYRYWIPRPLVSYLMKNLDEERCFSHLMPVTPVDEGISLLWVLTSVNFDKDGVHSRVTARNDEIFGQDIPVIESQRPNEIPQDLHQELHVRADKLSVLYRRWLGELGFGEAVRPDRVV